MTMYMYRGMSYSKRSGNLTKRSTTEAWLANKTFLKKVTYLYLMEELHLPLPDVCEEILFLQGEVWNSTGHFLVNMVNSFTKLVLCHGQKNLSTTGVTTSRTRHWHCLRFNGVWWSSSVGSPSWHWFLSCNLDSCHSMIGRPHTTHLNHTHYGENQGKQSRTLSAPRQTLST